MGLGGRPQYTIALRRRLWAAQMSTKAVKHCDAVNSKSPSTSQRTCCRTFVAKPAPLNLKAIVEVGLLPRGHSSVGRCQQIHDVLVPQVAEQLCAGMLECSEKEAWTDGSAPVSELHNALCVVVHLSVFPEEAFQLLGRSRGEGCLTDQDWFCSLRKQGHDASVAQTITKSLATGHRAACRRRIEIARRDRSSC